MRRPGALQSKRNAAASGCYGRMADTEDGEKDTKLNT